MSDSGSPTRTVVAGGIAPTTDELTPGEVIGGYQILSKLGQGGFGIVYRAVHPIIGKQAAIKVLSRDCSADSGIVSRFVDEARAVNQIKNSHIVDIFGFGSLPDGRFYYVMELLDGEPLDELLDRAGHLHPTQALSLLADVARALDAAHAKGIAHRDLKPENVFLVRNVDGSASAKLLDFGIAKLFSDAERGRTRTGAPIGTPSYMSPEQCQCKEIDHRTDVYSFGVLAFELLTGRAPFVASSQVDVMLKHVSEPPPRASQQHPGLPALFDAPIAHMLAKAPHARPSSVGAAFFELARAAADAGFEVELDLLESKPAGLHIERLRIDAELRHAATVRGEKLGSTAPSSIPASARPKRSARMTIGAISAIAVLGLIAVIALRRNVDRVPASRQTTAASTPSGPRQMLPSKPAAPPASVSAQVRSIPARVGAPRVSAVVAVTVEKASRKPPKSVKNLEHELEF